MSQKRLLVRGVNWVGDAVMSMPAIHAVRKAYPGYKISLLVKPWVAGLFEKDPDIDEVILYREEHKSLLGKLRLSRELKKKEFQSAILFQNAFDAALLAYLSRIPRRIGYARDMRGPLLTNAVPYHGEDRKGHHIDYFLNLLKGAGLNVEAVSRNPWIFLDIEERLRARAFIKNLSRPVIGLNPGAAFGSSKRWLPENFGKLALKIKKDLGGSAVIFGSKGEIQIAKEILEIVSPPNIISFAGNTDLREAAALISECDAMVSNDSGLMHVAYAVGTPVVALFGSTEPGFTGPPEGHFVIKRDLPCSPCLERECKRKDPVCMNDIKPSEVFEGLEKILPFKKAVFFDRDGTLCEDANYLSNWKDLKLSDGINELQALKGKGFTLVGVSNQSGIGRGLVEEGFVREVNRFFIKEHGFTSFYYCPHLPEENCCCRKPSPGMLLQARMELGLDLKSSYMVGDKESDMLAASAVGAKGVYLNNTQDVMPGSAWRAVKDLKEAVRTIIEAETGN